MGIFEVLLLSVGLAMDAFAVSICKGLTAGKITIKECLICGVWFGVFQGLMPFIGYMVGSRFEKWIGVVAPWVAFALLLLIGINMIREAFSEEEETKAGFGIKQMFPMAIATSIDALAVGITFIAFPVEVFDASKMFNTVFACITITIVTFIISFAGVRIGSAFGIRYKSGSEVAGGTILIFIGFYSLITSLDKSGALSDSDTIFGMLIPFAGTLLGALFVYTKRKTISDNIRMIFAGSSAGIMLSIAVWGMLKPSIGNPGSADVREILFIFLSFCAGVGAQFLLDHLVPHTHAYVDITEGLNSKLKPETKVMLSEVIHHIPEGIALGTIYAAHFMKTDWISASTAFVLAIAVAVQNFPEALFVSLPIRDKGNGVGKAFFMGVISGVPVPIMAMITLVVVVIFPGALSYIMAAAAGAIIFTVVEEIPQMYAGKDNDKGALAFVAGFALVMFMIFVKM